MHKEGMTGLAISTALFCAVMVVLYSSAQVQNFPKVSLKYDSGHEDQNPKKVILLYTDFFTGPWYLRWSKHYPCAFDCKFTYNKSVLNTADAVGFHDADLPRVLPQRTKLDQIWFYFNFESPDNSKSMDYKNVFNWTMSYRTDSDVFAPYGDYEPLSCSEAKAIKNFTRKRNFAANKTKMAAWVSSNCGQDLIGRLKYAKRLSSYINVDIYGKCGKLVCKRGSTSRLSNDCKQKLKNYKFYLAFENSLCYDYITEKYWQNALENNLLPVVMGGADYHRIAIPGSFINVEEFESVKHLADYLKYLDRNDTAYNEYFKWKNTYRLSTPYMYGCALCSALHSEKAKKFKVYPSLHKFWKEKKCRAKIDIK